MQFKKLGNIGLTTQETGKFQSVLFSLYGIIADSVSMSEHFFFWIGS